MRVAVIGAGAAGLCAVRHLIAKPKTFQVVGFEQGDRVGGTWIYTDKKGQDEYGLPIHSSMYKNLRTNLPKEVMAFPDFPFDKNLPSFVRHEDVLKYLEDYAEHFDLYPFIKFRTHVVQLLPKKCESKLSWEITYNTLSDVNKSQTDQFDAVIVCNGHYSVPIIPNIAGLDSFKGEIIHSHLYRDAETMRNKRVVCLGAGASGQDIAIEISSTAKMVFLSHNKSPLQSVLPTNIQQCPGIDRVEGKTVVLTSGEILDVDIILLCTGYHYSFPFLTEQCHLSVDKEERITPLYKHLIHTEFPSLCFIGLCKTICPFPQFNVQVQFFLASLDGSFTLPSKEEMDKDTEKDLELRLSQGLPLRHAHTMATRQWEYNNQLAKMANLEPIPPGVQVLYDMVHEKRVKNLPGYKKINYRMTGPESFETIEA
ncbi:hypothetical protein SNE40_008086 [Patella caerulea]|uniref:Flavin-containing monooxygenase n=1 Tax=Patella caerulea TaxID=87958 RepID=A0AAN8K165_PATCE